MIWGLVKPPRSAISSDFFPSSPWGLFVFALTAVFRPTYKNYAGRDREQPKMGQLTPRRIIAYLFIFLMVVVLCGLLPWAIVVLHREGTEKHVQAWFAAGRNIAEKKITNDT